MNKEPIGFYIFRILLGFGLFAFMAMLYWSNALIELDIKSIRSDISELKNDFISMRSDTNKTLARGFSTSRSNNHFSIEKNGSTLSDSEASESEEDSKEDPLLPNLLSEDPFYKTTLPKLLGPDFKPLGTRREASVGKPDTLHPFSNWSYISSWVGQCSVSLATQHFGKYETYAPEMANKMELRTGKDGKPEYWLHLRKDVYWEPLNQAHFSSDVQLAPFFLHKHQVTAHDFKFFYDAIMNIHVDEGQAVALRTFYDDIREVEVIDDFTLAVKWKTENIADETGKVSPQMKYLSKNLTVSLRPLASFIYKYFPDGTKIVGEDANPDTYRTNPIWAQNFAGHWAKNVIASCGPWIFDGLTERQIRFKRNPNYFFSYANLVDAMEVTFKNSPDEIWEEFKTGSLDLFSVPPNQLTEADRFVLSAPYKKQERNHLAIKRLDYVNRSYNYVGWNEANPLFKSKKVRQALTMAIDRKRIIENNLNNMGIEITGTFFRFSPSYDESLIPYPFDPEEAKKILAEEGWYDSHEEGTLSKIIDRKHTPFTFRLTYFVKSPIAKSIAEYISTAFKDIGITCNTEGVDMADLSAAFEDKSFDAIFMGWSLGSPPEDPKQLWYTAKEEKGSSNAIGFSNPEIDKIIDRLAYEYNPEKRIELYHTFDKILYDESPYTFLYTPKSAMIYREYLQNVFIPAERQDIIPGANVEEPQSNIFWIKRTASDSSATPNKD